MSSRIAIIDMGTNTFHLLLAEVGESGHKVIYKDRVAVKMGKGGINRGVITEEGIQRALTAMENFEHIIRKHGATQTYAFGTSALRNASNQIQVAMRIKNSTGIDVHIISGDQEAAYIYEGVKSAVTLADEPALIIDIGGGSVEFIIANQSNIFWTKSIEIGAQRLLEQFHQNDPINVTELSRLDDHFANVLKPVFAALQDHPTSIMVGSSGSFDTFSDIFCARHGIHNRPEAPETPLSISGFYEIYDELIHKTRDERMRIPGMIEMRVDMIVVASCMVRYLLEHWKFDLIRVSTYSLKEGVLSTLIRQAQQST
jgi:exopolyphosphatase / guanosine-5'-triphosphate,3'-diphosphate pyrophosphatase